MWFPGGWEHSEGSGWALTPELAPRDLPTGGFLGGGLGVGVPPASKELGSDKPALLGGEPQWEALGLGVMVEGTGTPGTPWV